MKIYFAGSIRGGRVDAGLYRQIISYLQQKGHDVLTEHVGSDHLCLEEQTRDRDAAIYNQDTTWLRESDVVIAECTCPSLGVGYELAYAERFEIPVHIFYNPSKCALSAMLTGDSYFHIHPYEKEEDIFSMIDNIL
ncbi:MAG: nucleoside 2-deoxyribosyltransferase [Muribaculaceae bacterium]|nr:nucleoside 2-deoxyribosyltransferase [Muribaculaceae bacterium]